MTDIVERLRDKRVFGAVSEMPEPDGTCQEAADEIERLQAKLYHYDTLESSFHAANKLIEQQQDEIERLRAALKEIDARRYGNAIEAFDIARRALGGKAATAP